MLRILFGAGFFGPRGCFRNAESRIFAESFFRASSSSEVVISRNMRQSSAAIAIIMSGAVAEISLAM